MKKKCPRCNSKVSPNSNFCNNCGLPLRPKQNDFGMLGNDDNVSDLMNNARMPRGMEKIMGSLIKQLEKQFESMGMNEPNGMPKGIRIQIAKSPPNMNGPKKVEHKQKDVSKVSEKELQRRLKLPRTEAESRVKRIEDNIVYEIKTPGIKKRDEISITELASGYEMKAYSPDKCYVKFIPLKTDDMNYYVEKDKVSIELKS